MSGYAISGKSGKDFYHMRPFYKSVFPVVPSMTFSSHREEDRDSVVNLMRTLYRLDVMQVIR